MFNRIRSFFITPKFPSPVEEAAAAFLYWLLDHAPRLPQSGQPGDHAVRAFLAATLSGMSAACAEAASILKSRLDEDVGHGAALRELENQHDLESLRACLERAAKKASEHAAP